MLTATKSMLLEARKQNYAVPAFNVYNMETVQAAFAASEKRKHPVIIALGERHFDTADVEGFSAMVKAMAEKTDLPVALHLDHAYEKQSIIRAIENGFTSVMYDGSKYSLEENIERTKEIVEIAHAAGVSVEAEIGSLQRGAFSDEEEGTGALTDPEQARRFVAETGIDFLAAAIGTVHGMYTGEPNIDIPLLGQIREKIDIPLVLHGGSGTPDDIIRETIDNGICKININTEVSMAALAYLKQLGSDKKTPHFSNVMSDMQRCMEEAMDKFIVLFQNKSL